MVELRRSNFGLGDVTDVNLSLTGPGFDPKYSAYYLIFIFMTAICDVIKQRHHG